MIVLFFDLVSDVVVCSCSQSVCLFCVLTWLDIRLFVVAHKVHVGLCFELVSDVVVCF